MCPQHYQEKMRVIYPESHFRIQLHPDLLLQNTCNRSHSHTLQKTSKTG